MPELPDVEIFRQRLEKAARRRQISEVRSLDKRLLDNVSPGRLSRRLMGRRIIATTRHGKYLLAELGDGLLFILHFGMTGELVALGKGVDAPRHTALHIVFDDGTGLAVTSRRRLGRITVADCASAFINSHDLGPDALDPALDVRSFRAALGSPRCAIKSALFDQSKLAGIGNIYSDEILFQARVNPNTRVGELSSEDVERLFKTMRQLLQEAVELDLLVEGREGALPKDWLMAHREETGQCPRCNTQLRTAKVGGRKAYFCPSCQAN